MAYRLLLPSSETLFPKQIEEALGEFDVFRTSGLTPTWSITDLAVDEGDGAAHRLSLRLLRDDVMDRESGERFFLRPDNVHVWLELRTIGAADDRGSRLAARLCAVTIATRLGLAVLETRNGVFCRTPEAFTAWCSRTTHPETILIGKDEHRTTLPSRSPGLVRPSVRRDTAVAPMASRANAPLPRATVFQQIWRRIRGLRTYVVTVPASADQAVLAALVVEITATFGNRNVLYDESHDRLLIVGKDSPGTAEVVTYYRRRAHPERLRMLAMAK